jgi:predicted nucleic acid-binding protein
MRWWRKISMPGEIKYFFDTYAIVAILDDAKEYQGFEINKGVTTTLNLMETQYSMHKRGAKDAEIKRTLSNLSPLCIGFSEESCFDSVKFRYENRKRELSYIDCLGYVLAKKNGVPFLTGDKGFKELPNVKFVRVSD